MALSREEKVREIRLRNTAGRQALTLQRSRRRDPRAIGYGTYQLVNACGDLVAGDRTHGYGLTLDDIERYLTEGN